MIERSHERRPPGDAAAFVLPLLEASRRGDAVASYRIYLVVDECENALSPDVMGSQHLTRAMTPGYPARLARLMKECEALVTNPALQGRGRWLSTAAAQGSIEAALVYSIAPRQVLGSSEQWLKNPERVMDYKHNAMTYLHQAARRGSLDALSALAGAYSKDFFVTPDPVKALAYRQVVAGLDPSDANQRLLERAEQFATPSQRYDAMQQAALVKKTCCETHGD